MEPATLGGEQSQSLSAAISKEGQGTKRWLTSGTPPRDTKWEEAPSCLLQLVFNIWGSGVYNHDSHAIKTKVKLTLNLLIKQGNR
jgi:hypothetical protein